MHRSLEHGCVAVGAPLPALIAAALLLAMLAVLPRPARAAGGDASQPVPPEIVEALKSLKAADADQRQKIYDLLATKGDARLIPAIKAYKDGLLQIRDGKLVMFGERVKLPGQDTTVLPLIDALTGEPINGADGKPIYFARMDLSKAIKSPPRSEKSGALSDLLAALSLLDPDPIARTASIRDAAERAARAVPDPADAAHLRETFAACSAILNSHLAKFPGGAETPALRDAIAAMHDAQVERPASTMAPAPSDAAIAKVKSALGAAQTALASSADNDAAAFIANTLSAASSYDDRLEQKKKVLDELPKTAAALRRQLEKNPNGPFAPALHEAIASIQLVTGDSIAQKSAAKELGSIATGRAANLLQKVVDVAQISNDADLRDAAANALRSANRYQTEVHFIQNTFAGLSAGSILVLMALGLSIIFGLMGVINMAQGEFMMVGAFTTFVVAETFKRFFPGAYEYYLLAAVPAAFIVAGLIGFLVEWLVIRHLYGRPLETLLATWGIGLVMIWSVRKRFGDNVSVKPPNWMEGGWEIAPDLVFPLNRVYIILYCAICISVVYLVVNRTKLGLLLRATTQNREMASALGVPTRRVDGMTFAFGAALAGLAGVAVPLYNKINPNVGQEYIVDCFMVVVVGGVGKLAGVVWAGLGLGFIGKYLEPILGAIPSLASGSSVIGKVLVLAMIIVFLQWRPQGLFPPKGRNADA